MGSKLNSIVYGVGGVGGVQLVTEVLPADPSTITEVGGLIVQILIAIASLFGLFKKKKNS